jgi:hypothetical protein
MVVVTLMCDKQRDVHGFGAERPELVDHPCHLISSVCGSIREDRVTVGCRGRGEQGLEGETHGNKSYSMHRKEPDRACTPIIFNDYKLITGSVD